MSILGKRYNSDQRIRLKLPKASHVPQRMQSGQVLLPIGRRQRCPGGLHHWYNKYVFGVPFLTCSKCGYRVPKPQLERTASAREMIEVTQKNMERRVHNTMYHPKPFSKYPDKARQKAIDWREKQLERLVVKLWEQQQRNPRK